MAFLNVRRFARDDNVSSCIAITNILMQLTHIQTHTHTWQVLVGRERDVRAGGRFYIGNALLLICLCDCNSKRGGTEKRSSNFKKTQEREGDGEREREREKKRTKATSKPCDTRRCVCQCRFQPTMQPRSGHGE